VDEKITICIAGKNEIAVKAIEYLLNDLKINKNNLLICSNKTDDGKDDWQPSLKKKAIEKEIKDVKLSKLYSINNLLFISLEYDQLIKPQNFNSNNLFNIHFSLLPKYKGMYTSVFPILKGDHESGVTLHKIDDSIDTGDIISQLSFEITLKDTCRILYLKYLEYGFKLFKINIPNLIENNYISVPQCAANSTYNSKNSIDFSKVKINLNKTSFEIHNQIRSIIFEEYQFPIVYKNEIIHSILTNEKIQRNYVFRRHQLIILSGVDGFKIILTTRDR